MTRAQRFFAAILPSRWFRQMERESRDWVMQCSHCQGITSIWDMGGIRWKAAGNPRRFGRCQHCKRTFWGRVYRRRAS